MHLYTQERKEVIYMADMKRACGCGCIPLKRNITKVAKDKKKARKPE
jgi:hypothetical protein